MLVNSYRTACEIHRNRRWYRQRQAEIDAAFKEIHRVANEVYGKSEDDIPNSATPAPRCHDHEANASTGVAGSEED